MAISQSKYVNITSTVAGSPAVTQRDLIGRVFTTNYLVPSGQVLEFNGGASAALQSVGEYFGTTSVEYEFASQYFGFISKKGTQPQKLSFYLYANNATNALLFGSVNPSLTALKAISSGTLTISLNGTSTTEESINLSSANSLSDVASTLTSALSAASVTVEYDAVNARFVLQSTATGSGNDFDYATGTVAEAIGWTSGVGILSAGADATSALDTVSDSASISNNFFSYTFLAQLNTSDITAIAQWNNAQNVKYMFSITVSAEDAQEIQTAVTGNNGVALTYDAFDMNAGYMPMAAFAAVDYSRPNAAINMMYQVFDGVQPSVSTDAESSLYDGLLINYYGATQQAGQTVSFYQNGVLQGSISDMGVYANEAWLKDSFLSNILNFRINLDTLPANNTGVGLLTGIMMDTVNQALNNGVILPGKTLTTAQKATITQLTGNTDAWLQVQSSGYYLTVNLVQYSEDGVEKYKASFLFVYAKGDSINYVDGSDILI